MGLLAAPQNALPQVQVELQLQTLMGPNPHQAVSLGSHLWVDALQFSQARNLWCSSGTQELMHAMSLQKHTVSWMPGMTRTRFACTCWPHSASGPLHGLSRLCSYQEAG